MSTPTVSPSAAADRDPNQEDREHLKQVALEAPDRAREVLPPSSSTPRSARGDGEPT